MPAGIDKRARLRWTGRRSLAGAWDLITPFSHVSLNRENVVIHGARFDG
jgi:hypothetical protein